MRCDERADHDANVESLGLGAALSVVVPPELHQAVLRRLSFLVEPGYCWAVICPLNLASINMASTEATLTSSSGQSLPSRFSTKDSATVAISPFSHVDFKSPASCHLSNRNPCS